MREMPLYPPTHSTFEVDTPPPEAPEEIERKQASASSVKWVYILTAIVLLALVILTAVGPHIPAGE